MHDAIDKIEYDPSDLPAGVEVGAVIAAKYRLEALIGMGGMGSVWRATHLGLNQLVAIKIVAPDFARSAEARRRFDVEAKASAQLKSRHVVQVTDNGELADGTPFMAMELLQGEPLGKRIHKHGPLPVLDALRVALHVGRALSRAHALGIVHRDIKPENIFLATSDEEPGFTAKVLDFGIAKVRATNAGEQSATRTGSLLGTPLYMSPEQARALKTVDHRTDVYSLGLVVYTMLTGNLAFSGESYADVIVQICTMPLPTIRGSAPWVPEHVDTWLTHACAKEPQVRYQDMQSMVDALCIAAGFPPGSPELGYPIGPGQAANPYAGTMPVTPSREQVLGFGSHPGSAGFPAAAPQIGRAQSSGGFAAIPVQGSGAYAALPPQQHQPSLGPNSPIPVGTMPMMSPGWQNPGTGNFQAVPQQAPPQTSAPWVAPVPQAPAYVSSGNTNVELPKRSNAPWIVLLVLIVLGGGGAGLYFGVLADGGKSNASEPKEKSKEKDKEPKKDDSDEPKEKADKPKPSESTVAASSASASAQKPPEPKPAPLPGNPAKPPKLPPPVVSVVPTAPTGPKPPKPPAGPDLGF